MSLVETGGRDEVTDISGVVRVGVVFVVESTVDTLNSGVIPGVLVDGGDGGCDVVGGRRWSVDVVGGPASDYDHE